MKKSLIGSLLFLCIFLGLKKNSAFIFSPPSYQLYTDSMISPQCQALIKEFIKRMDASLSSTVVIEQLQKQFPFFRAIAISIQPSCRNIHVTLYKPVCCINDNFVLTDNGLFSKNIFNSSIIENIMRVFCEQNLSEQSMKSIKEFVSQFSSEFNKELCIHYNNEHYVKVFNKTIKDFFIVFDAHSHNITALLSHCALVWKNISQKKQSLRTPVVLDTRFTDYIIAYKV